MAFLDDLGAAPPTGTEPPTLESLLGSPAPEMGFLEKFGDIIGRPYAAVGETVGALRSGEESPLTAMKRGFWEGEQLYEDLAEQLIPTDPTDDQDTKIAKDIGRFGISMGGDPLMYVPAGVITKPAKFLSKGARLADKVLRKIPMPQVVARMTLPMTHVFKKFGGSAGAVASRKLKDAYGAHKVGAGSIEQMFMDKLKKLELLGDGNTPFRKAAMDLLEGAPASTAYHTDSRTQQLFQFLRDKLDGSSTRITSYKDPTGKKFKVVEPMLLEAKENVIKKARKLKVLGKKWSSWRDEVWDAFEKGTPLPTKDSRKAKALHNSIVNEMSKINYKPRQVSGKGTINVFKKGFHQQAWKARENYAPYMLNEAFSEKLFSAKKGYAPAVRQFAKQLSITEEKALDILRNMALPKRAGNIEYARHLPFSDEMFEKDPLIWFPKYVNKVEERIAYADQFGLDGQILDGLVATMKGDAKATIDKKWLRDARDIILGKYQSDRSITELASKIMGVQVLTKMGPLSTLSNLSQSAGTIVREGGINFLKGVLRASTTEGRRQGYIAYQKGIQDELIKLAGGKKSWAHKYLSYTGFNYVEQMNRVLAANAGIVRGEQLVRNALRPGGGGRLTQEMIRRNIKEADLLNWKNLGGKFAEESAERIGLAASDATQHATHWKDLPIGWQDPMMKIMTQYKNFIYQQTRFLLKDVLRPAKEYFESGGHQGSLAPLMRAGVTFGIAAEVTAFTRDQVKMVAAKGTNSISEFLGGGDILEYEPREREDQWFFQLLRDSLHVGALGIAGDLVERASYKDLSGWLLGPTFGDATDFVEEAAATVGRMSKGKDQPWERWMRSSIRRAPFIVGAVPSKAMEPLAGEVVGSGRDFLKEIGL